MKYAISIGEVLKNDLGSGINITVVFFLLIFFNECVFKIEMKLHNASKIRHKLRNAELYILAALYLLLTRFKQRE